MLEALPMEYRCVGCLQDPERYDSAGIACRLDEAIRQCMSLSSKVQVSQGVLRIGGKGAGGDELW